MTQQEANRLALEQFPIQKELLMNMKGEIDINMSDRHSYKLGLLAGWKAREEEMLKLLKEAFEAGKLHEGYIDAGRFSSFPDFDSWIKDKFPQPQKF